MIHRVWKHTLCIFLDANMLNTDTLSILNLNFCNYGKRLKVEAEVIKAIAIAQAKVLEFETPHKPPVIFERNEFYKELEKSLNKNKLELLSKEFPDIVNKKADNKNAHQNDFDRLKIAMKINAEAAFNITYWGPYELRGFKAEELHYKDVSELAIQHIKSIDGCVEGLVRVIENNRSLTDALCKKDFTRFCLLFNYEKRLDYAQRAEKIYKALSKQS